MEKLSGRELFKDHVYNCAQSTFVSLAEEVGLTREMAFRLSSAFGGSARSGNLCGAVSGALMALGYVKANEAGDKEGQKEAYAFYIEFNRRFKERFGALNCRELVGCDMSTPEGKAFSEAHPEVKAKCPELIEGAIEIAREMLAEIK